MTNVIRIDSNGNIVQDKTQVEDDEQLMIGEDSRRGVTPQSIPDEHNANENIFRVTINCDDESVTSDRDDDMSQMSGVIDTGRDKPPNVTVTSTTEFNDTDVVLPPVFSDDVPPPPLPSSMPPTSVPILPSTAPRPQTILLPSGFEKDILSSPLTIILPPPSPYAASPVDEVPSMPVSELHR